jgi:hypothetical protein
VLADSICGSLHVVVYELRDMGYTRGKVRVSNTGSELYTMEQLYDDRMVDGHYVVAGS